MDEENWIVIGKIVGVHGIAGTLKMISYAESDILFSSETRLYTKNSAGGFTPVDLRWIKPYKNILRIRIQKVDDRSTAQNWVGTDVFVSKENLPPLAPGEYYWKDLIGLKVYSTQDEYLGRIESVIRTGANDVYVARKDEEELLIPALEQVVVSVDLAQKALWVKLLEEL